MINLLTFFCLFLFLSFVAPRERKVSSQSESHDPNDHLLQAASEGNLREVRVALKFGSFLNARDKGSKTPLMLACINNHYEVVKELLNKGADYDLKTSDGDRSALLWSVFMNNIKIVTLLLSYGADVNEINRRGDTPLIIASYMGHVEMLFYLINEGADIHHKTVNKLFTALHFAAFKGHFQVVNMLLENGFTDIDALDSDGRTPLMLAALKDSVDVVELLKNHGSDINQQDNMGFTALFLCIKSLYFRCTHYLLSLNNCDKLLSTKNGDNMITIAIHSNSLEMVKLTTLNAVETLTDSSIIRKAIQRISKAENPEIQLFLQQFLDEPSL
jgi:ankyrin repeat protein